MRSVVRGSSRYAYVFVSFNLLLLLIFFVSSSLNLREVTTSRHQYERIVRDWFALRLAMVDPSQRSGSGDAFDAFAESVSALLSSELFNAASRLSERLAASGERLRDAWVRLAPLLRERAVTTVVRTETPGADIDYLIGVFQDALLGFEDVLTEFVALQQRALQILLYFLGATILGTIGIFLLVEFEIERERRAASQVRTLAQVTIRAQEQERARISHSLHDSLAQELSVALLEVGDLTASGSPLAADQLRKRLRSAVDWVRNLAHELHPAEIDEVGLASALSAYCAERAAGSTASLEWSISDDVCTVPRAVAINVYRLAQEAISNALRHADARRVTVRIGLDSEGLLMNVLDDGRGFRVGAPGTSGQSRGIGLVGMRERANMLGARLEIASERGAGTRVTLTVPIDALGCTEEE